MLKLTHLSAILFSGTDAGSFLHRQLSADVLGLANGESTFACYCEPKGRVLALMLVQKVNEDYYVIMSGTLATAVIGRLTIYRMRSKVVIEVLHGYTISGLQADDTPELALKEAHAIQIPGSRQWLVVASRDITTSTTAVLQEEWRISELSLGITWLNPETSGEFLPQMLGFEALGAVNYRKGCYPGQEIVARTHYLGKVKRHPRLLNCKLVNCPKPMDKIKILDDDKGYDAVVADCVIGADGNVYLLVVTRMDPGLTARQIEYLDESATVL
jgi:folate-binding protein YgfZ